MLTLTDPLQKIHVFLILSRNILWPLLPVSIRYPTALQAIVQTTYTKQGLYSCERKGLYQKEPPCQQEN